jgi:hypothetical protein
VNFLAKFRRYFANFTTNALKRYLHNSPAKIPKMAMVILNSLVVHKGFLKRQGGIIELINPYSKVVVRKYLGSNGHLIATIP